MTLTHGSPQEFLTIQYSTPFSSTPQPATDTMWLIKGLSTYSEYTPPVYASSLSVAIIPQLQTKKKTDCSYPQVHKEFWFWEGLDVEMYSQNKN